MKRMALVVVMMFVGMAMTASAGLVQLDMSSAFNYDAVGTANEIAFCNTQAGNHRLSDVLTQHSMQWSSLYLGDDPTGLPADGLVDGGNFEIGKGLARRYDSADWKPNDPPMTKVHNCALVTTNNSTGSVQVDLTAGDQRTYSDINFLLNGRRHSDAGKTYTAKVEVKYAADAAWHTVWSASGTATGGSFTSGGVGGQGDWHNATDSDPTWALGFVSDRHMGAAGSDPNRYSNIRNEDRYLWKFSSNLLLDETQVLESFKLTTSTNGVNRQNDFWLFAASANEFIPPPIPEPAGLGLVGLALLALKRRRS